MSKEKTSSNDPSHDFVVIYDAVKNDDLEVFKKFSEFDQKNSKGPNEETMMHVAAEHGSRNILEYLIDTQRDQLESGDAYLSRPIHYAAKRGQNEIILLLLENGANVNAVNSYNATALHYAVDEESKDTIKALLGYEPDLNIRDYQGNTPLLRAVINDSEDQAIIALLVRDGADISAMNNDGDTALHVAVDRLNRTLINALVTEVALKSPEKLKEFINAGDISGYTALHLAVAKGEEDLIRFFIRNGADVKLKSKDDEMTPIDLAKECGVDLRFFEASSAVKNTTDTELESEDRAALEPVATQTFTFVAKETLKREQVSENPKQRF